MNCLRAVIVAVCLLLTAAVLNAQQDGGSTIHVVQRGENLFRISLRYGLTVDQIASANGITRPDSIFVGQRLLIPTGAAAQAVQEVVHVVQPGETLEAIGALYGVTADALITRNGIVDPNSVAAGVLLVIPANGVVTLVPTPVPQPTDTAVIDPTVAATSVVVTESDGGAVPDPTQNLVHIVQRGESLFAIANEYGVEVMEIISANPLTDPSVIYPGQELVIPGVEPTQYAGALPAPIERLTVTPLVLVEGRTARIDFATSTSLTVTARFLDRDIPVVAQNDGLLHTLLIGVPLATPAGVHVLTLTDGAALNFPVNLQINGGAYRTESLTLAADRLDLINPNVDSAELELLRGVMSRYTAERLFDGLMSLPAAAPLSSPFGSLRSYNGGTFENTHTGTDFAAATGAPILAPAAGRVVLADTLNVRGVATVLDHGWGVYTGYWHQTERYVSLGDTVAAGQVIGAVGSTGRVTGAHLHWELWVNGVPVDPMQWVSESFG